MDMMLSCKEASRLSSQALDRKLATGERFALRFHLMLCGACTRVDRQFRFLRRAMAEMPAPARTSDETKP